MVKETKLSSALVYNGDFLKVQRDKTQIGEKGPFVREFIKHPGASMVLPRLTNDRFLMLRQYRYVFDEFFLEFPAGKIDPGETPLETAKREFQEETGFTANHYRFLTTIKPVIGYSDELIHIFLAEGLVHGPPPTEERALAHGGEQIELVEHTLNELLLKVQSGNLTDVKSQIGVFWLEKVIKNDW